MGETVRLKFNLKLKLQINRITFYSKLNKVQMARRERRFKTHRKVIVTILIASKVNNRYDFFEIREHKLELMEFTFNQKLLASHLTFTLKMIETITTTTTTTTTTTIITTTRNPYMMYVNSFF
jgi:hypothetical protein